MSRPPRLIRGKRRRGALPSMDPGKPVPEASVDRKPWEDWVVIVAAVWLFFAPFALGTPTLDHPATVTALLAAAMLVGAAAEAAPIPDAVQEWVIFAIGAGLAASPWLLDYADLAAPAANAAAVGGLVCACALSSLARRKHGRRGRA